MLILLSLLTCSVVLLADNDRLSKDIKELPVESREFLSTYFSHTKVSHIKIETNRFRNKSYEVLLTNGTEIEFDKSGKWTEINGHRKSIPTGVIPEKIREYVQVNYPGQEITAIEREGYETSVKLKNGLELTFNKRGKLIEIDT